MHFNLELEKIIPRLHSELCANPSVWIQRSDSKQARASSEKGSTCVANDEDNSGGRGRREGEKEGRGEGGGREKGRGKERERERGKGERAIRGG